MIKAIVPHKNIQELYDERDGGQIALRGYSYQFLYSCYIVLSSVDNNTDFYLEGVEDIDCISYHSEGKKTSHIQLKYSDNKQDASFFKPILKNYLEAYLIDSNRDFQLVYDFPVAPGNLSKLFEKKLDIKSTSYWTRIVNEIKDENSFWNWSDFNFDSFISLLSFEYVCKNSLESEIEKILIDRYEITTDNIKLFVNSIKILCFEKMEKRGSVTQADIDRCIQLVKIDISKGPQNPAHSWIRKIDFKEKSYNDTHSYFEGKKATPVDIINEIPIHRINLEKEIIESIRQQNVTVIKASSGQGKTTLALQVAYQLKEEYTTYQVLLCDDISKLGNISQFFISRIKVGEKPLILLDNLDSQLRYWNNLVQLMESEIHHHFRIILTSRETDWYYFSGDISNIQSICIIKPVLTRADAQELFYSLEKRNLLHKSISNWEKAWRQISDKQLLIEYIYLLTHGEMLSNRISSQMIQISSSQDGKAKCEILRKVCFADVCGIRLSTKSLFSSQKSNYDSDFGEILKSMENEFLIHITSDGNFIEGLHPVRSKHIVERLHETIPLEETILAVLKIVNFSDIAIFFSHLPEYKFEKKDLYNSVIEEIWNEDELSCLLSALQGLFSGNTLDYYRKNIALFDDANKHGGLYILSSDLCPFMNFTEINENISSIDKMLDIFPDNSNIAYIQKLRDSIPHIQLDHTDFYILCSYIYNKAMSSDFSKIQDTDSLATITEIIYTVNPKFNLAPKILLDKLWMKPQAYSIECISSFMYISYLANQETYMRFVKNNINKIISYIKEQTKSLRINVDEEYNEIHVEYILRLNKNTQGNKESVSRLTHVCKILPFFTYYSADAIRPKIEFLFPYSLPDDAHKKMPARNLIITFHKNLNSLWIKTILSNYEFDTVSEWLDYWIEVRKLICQLVENCCNFIFKLLGGKNPGKIPATIDYERELLSSKIYCEARYPKEDRPFEEKASISEEICRVKNDYYHSMLNFFIQFVNIIKKDLKGKDLALFNLRCAKSSLLSMQQLFLMISSGTEYKAKLEEINKLEESLLDELFATCEFYIINSASKYFDKYQIKPWYIRKQRNEIHIVKELLCELNSICPIIFPDKIYYKKSLSFFPIILDFETLQKETQGSWFIHLIQLNNSPFDYFVIINMDKKYKITPYAICISRFFLQKVIDNDDFDPLKNTFQPYPIQVNTDILECFDKIYEIKTEENQNPLISIILEIAEDLWIYSKYEIGYTESNKESYIIDLLSNIQKNIEQKLELTKNSNMYEELQHICDKVFSGQNFDDNSLNYLLDKTINA